MPVPIETAPLLPFFVDPEPKYTPPLFPTLAIPVLSTNTPLTPPMLGAVDGAALAVCSTNAPLLVTEL